MTMMKTLLAVTALCALTMVAIPSQADFKVGGSTVSVAAAQDHAEKTIKKRAQQDLRDKRHHRGHHLHHKRVKKAAKKSTDNNTHIDSVSGYNN